MESMLEGFQLHLGNISSEIHSLQQQSMQMNIKLKNRQVTPYDLLRTFHHCNLFILTDVIVVSVLPVFACLLFQIHVYILHRYFLPSQLDLGKLD